MWLQIGGKEISDKMDPDIPSEALSASITGDASCTGALRRGTLHQKKMESHLYP